MTPTTDIAVAPRSDLAISVDQTGWSEAQLAVIRQIGPAKATEADLTLFFHQCARTGLDPFLRQIHLVEYGGKPTIQVGIDGFRLVARRAADKAGDSLAYEPIEWCGEDGVWRDVWLAEGPPVAARAAVLRNGHRFPAVALYREFVGQKKVYRNKEWTGEWEVNAMWTSKPAHMIGKVAEAQALRKAFPQDLSGVYEPAERDPDVIAGEIVREERPAPPQARSLAEALEAVDGATSLDELRGVWQHFHGGLATLADRAQFDKAINNARAALETPATPPEQAPAQPTPSDRRKKASGAKEEAPAPGDAVAWDVLWALMAECGYTGEDRLRLARLLLADEVADFTTLTRVQVATLTTQLTEATNSGDPQAWIEQHTIADAVEVADPPY